MTGRFVNVNGQRLAVWECMGEGTPIVFAHATSFHARCWNQVIARLPERHAIAVDMRGHGLSSKPAPPCFWRPFGEDLAALAAEMKLEGAIGVGHSMGGHSLVLAAALAPRAFSSLLLLDPAIFPRQAYRGPFPPHFARKRKNEWRSADEMFERFAARVPFCDWDQAVLRDYCDWGLTAAGDAFVLACPPEVEASIYENSGSPDADLYACLDSVRIPVTIVRSSSAATARDPAADMSASPTAPDLASQFPKARDIVVPHSHFIPMEAPALVSGLVPAI